MADSIFRKTRDFLMESAQTEDAQSHSLKLTPGEFEAFKAIFIASAISHSYDASNFQKLDFDIARVVKGSANDLVLEGEGITARVFYDPEKQTMTLSGPKLPWKSLDKQLKAVKALAFDNGNPAERKSDSGGKPEEVVVIFAARPEVVQAFSAILCTIAQERGMDDTRIVSSFEATAAVPAPYVCVPKNMYDELRKTELLPGNSMESVRKFNRGGS